MTTITLQTPAPNRVIRQTIQALIKARAISSAYKIPHIKHYITNEKGSLTTHNIQRIVMFPIDNRDKSGKNILDNILKEWKEIDSIKL